MPRTGRELTRRNFVRKAACATAPVLLAGKTSRAKAEPALADSARVAGRLLAGAAVSDLTPPLGVSLKGPIGGNGTVRSIHDPLRARCLALDDGQARLAICVCDCTMIGPELVERAKRLAHEQTGLPIERMLISATHSHAAPRLTGVGSEEVDRKYYDYFSRQVAAAISGAVARLAPAKLGWGKGRCEQFVECRRSRIEPGSNGPNPFGRLTDRAWMYPKPATRLGATGPADPELSVLSVRHRDGRPLAVLANYSIHYVTGFTSGTVTADYYPHFARRIAELLEADGADSGFVGIMSNGNSGDTGPWRGGHEGMRTVGETLAEEALRVIRGIDCRDDVPLTMREVKMELGVRRPDAERLEWARQVLDGTWNQPAHHWRNVYAQQALDLDRYPATISPTFQALRIGRLGIAANPCEMYAETGLAIKKASPLETTFNIQLANGYAGYLPPPEQHALGGYTTWPAGISAGPQATTGSIWNSRQNATSSRLKSP
jgi:hypothetical protein